MYKNILRTLLVSILVIGGISQANAESIAKTIEKAGVNSNTVSISVKDVKTQKKIYELNSKRPQNPASTIKLITYLASFDTLGKDYNFETKLYKNTNNELFLKLGADPYLTSKDLKRLMKTAKSKNIVEPKNIYIDDSILDKNEWGEGWQWDDDLNPLMPKFSAYNLDNNLIGIVITPTNFGAPVEVFTEEFYPLTFINMATTGDENNIQISRNTSIPSNMLAINGTVSKQQIQYIPINNPKRYLKLRLEDSIRSSKIGYYKDIQNKKLPNSSIYLVDEITHPITQTADNVLKYSNNYVAESVFKIAGAKYTNATGSNENSMIMLDNFLNKLGVCKDNVKIVDASGVSKNNLVTADFMSDYLVKLAKYDKFPEFEKMIMIPGEGTLKNRMLYFKNNLKAKTGTLSDISAITGYITTQKDKTYAFDIMITDPKTSSQDKKNAEEYILRTIYNSY